MSCEPLKQRQLL